MSEVAKSPEKKAENTGFFNAFKTAAKEVSAEVRRDLDNLPPSGYTPQLQASPQNFSPMAPGTATFGESMPERAEAEHQPGAEEIQQLQRLIRDPWPVLEQPDKAEKINTDAYFHPYTAADLEHYAKDILPATNPEIISVIAVEAGEGPLLRNLGNLFIQSPGVYGSLGYNPRNLQQDMDVMDDTLTRILNDIPQFIALGPIGIDANYSSTSILQQSDQFIRQLEIAADFDLPAIIFHNKAVEHLKTALSRTVLPRRIVWLKPIRSTEELDLIHTIDAYVALRAEITYPKETFYQEALTQILPQRLLVGSGNSLNAVHAQAGQFNSSNSLPQVLQTAAKILGLSALALQARVNQNFAHVYGPPKAGL